MEKKLADKKKDTPQKGEFIDLDKSDFKKKTGLTKIFFKYLIIFIVFFSLGFLTYQPLKENFYQKFKGTEIIEQEVVKIDQGKLKNEYLLKLEKLENNFLEKLNLYEERINNLESKNKELSLQLDSVNQSFENFKEFNPNDSYLLDYKKNKVLINFLIFQENFNYRKVFGNEIEILQNLFLRDYEVNNLLTFFKTLDIQNLRTKENLIQKINKELSVYDNDIDDLFTKIENNTYSDTSNIFSSKEEFINYTKDVINSTFKVTKFDQEKKKEDVENLEPAKKTLLLVKESLLVNNINQAIKVLEESSIDDINLKSWLNEAKILAEANTNFNKFKIKLLDLME
ncbi:hypothetical protein OAY92_01160 [Alphaproteobacteria bacterium]|nr:hypothetical protein [Alphaproteobacteria bacterium]